MLFMNITKSYMKNVVQEYYEDLTYEKKDCND